MKKWGAQIALALLGVFLSLVMIEMGLRVFYPQYSGKPVQFHPVLGFSPIPNYDDTYIWPGHESVTHFHTNSLGFRDSEIHIPKPENVFRTLVLGDSMTFGIGVEEEEAFTEVIEKMLNDNAKAGDVRYEVINAGVPGYSTAQELLQYRLYGQQLNPDLVILAFLVTNDLLDNLCAEQILPDRTFVHADPAKPCFALRDEELVEMHNPQRPKDVPNRKELFSNVKSLHTWIFFRSRMKNILTSNVEVIELVSNLGIDVEASYVPGTLSWYMEECGEGWPLTEKLLGRLKEEVADDGGRLVVVVLPSRIQTTERYLELTRLLFADLEETAEFQADFTRPQDLLMNWGEKEQVLVLDCLPDIKEAASTRPLNLQDGHFNATGHRVVAEIIYNYIIQNGLSLHKETSE